MATATSTVDLVLNSLIILFVLELDEKVFTALQACSENWTSHTSESEPSSNSNSEAEKEAATVEMKKEIELQKVKIADQREQLEMLRSQQEKTALEMEKKITKLRETVLKMLESQVAAISSESTPQCTDESLTTHTSRLKDSRLDVSAGEGEIMNTVEDENSCQEGAST